MRSICGEKIVSATGLDNINFNKMLSLNSTAAFLWEKFYGIEFSLDDMADALTDAYVVERDIALKDSVALIKAWKNAGVLDE